MVTDNEISISVIEGNEVFKKRNEINNFRRKTNNNKPCCLRITIFALVLAAISAIIIIIYAIIPCLMTTCHSNAYCNNKPFNAQCKCKYGFNGDGKKFCDECGITYTQENLRIIGGIEAARNSWPMAVLIYISYKTIANLDGENVLATTSTYCGGSLIDRQTVLTAGHCILTDFDFEYNEYYYTINVTENNFYPKIESIYKVYVGAHLMVNLDQFIGDAQPYNVEKAIRHENFDKENILYDIALLKLNKPVELNQNVQLTCLPNPKFKFYPTPQISQAIAIGWGYVDNYGNTPKSLNNVVLNIYNYSYCENTTSSYKNNELQQICAGEYNGGKDTCQGDSGGSLFVKDTLLNKTKFITAGIVSYGQGCALKNFPGIYTRVSYFIDWIEANV